MYKVVVKNNEYKVSVEQEKIIFNDQPVEIDLVKLSKGKYHIISNNKSYTAELVDIDKAKKCVTIKINNNLHEVVLKDKMDALLEKLGMDNFVEAKAENLKAPMPGLILEISVKKGQIITKGDKLLVLEAMKMENVIKATGDAIVADIKVNEADSVENGQVLITFE